MHLCDSNVFVAAAVGGHLNHRVAAGWFRSITPAAPAAFCRATQLSFLRLLTQRIAPGYEPVTNRGAWSVYLTLRQDHAVAWADEPEDLLPFWQERSAHPSPSPKLWMDAYLAAFALAGKHRLVTFDRAFRQFDGLDLELLGPVAAG